MKGGSYMEKYEKPQLLLDDTEEELCIDVHSSGIGLAVVSTIILALVWPPIDAG